MDGMIPLRIPRAARRVIKENKTGWPPWPSRFQRNSATSDSVALARFLHGRGERRHDFEHVTDRPGHDRRYAIDSGKLRAELSWTPTFVDFASGLQATIDWYRDNEAWWRPQKAATEQKYAATQTVVA